MGFSDLTSLSHIYKRKYSDQQVAEVAGREHPTWMMIRKQGGFSGELVAYAIDYSFPQGIGGTLAGAQTASGGSAGKQLTATRKAKFGVIRLNNEAIAACSSDGALYDMATKETDRILREMGDSFGFDLFGDGSGIRGRRASISTNTVTLTDATQVRNFKINMTVGATANADGSSPRTGTTTVTAIDESAGTVTLASAAAITSFANNDYLFRATENTLCMEGMAKATPTTAPVLGGDSFRGIDRGIDVQGLAGVRVTGTGNIVADFGTIAVKAHMRGKKLRKGVLSPTNFWTVSQLLDAKVEFDNGGGTAEVGFEYITINTPGGAMRIYSDPDCPATVGRAFDPEAHYIWHLNGVPHLDRRGNSGDVEMRMASDDAVEVRARGWLNYFQNDTASHGVITI